MSGRRFRQVALIIVAPMAIAVLAGCGPGYNPNYSVNLESTNIDYNLEPNEWSLYYAQEQDIERKKGESEWIFAPQKNYEIAGYVIGAQAMDKAPVDVMACSMGLIWDKPAIELAKQSGGKRDDSKLSQEAKEILRVHGCPAGYLNKHTVTLMTIGATEEIDTVLRVMREGYGIYMKGMVVKAKSSKYKGLSGNFNLPIMLLYVTELRLGEDTFISP